MTDTTDFAVLLMVIALVVLLAITVNRLALAVRLPAPALVLIASAGVLAAVPAIHTPPERAVEDVATAALVLILFEGGMGIGVRRLRSALSSVVVVGVLGTFLTTAAGAVVGHVVLGLGWYAAVLVATAIAPTDPAVVFSVLGQREVAEPSGTLLEGESGANDPVGIALMASLLAAGGLTGGAAVSIAGAFVLQMVVGGAVGLAGGIALRWTMRRIPLASEGLYPLRTLAAALAIFGIAVVAHGSGFLAVFVAGILIGDDRAPYKREIEHFHAAAASLAEIVVFVVLGLTVRLGDLVRPDVWIPGLVLAVVLTVLIRPLAVGPLLLRSRLDRGERGFVLFAGLKGAVPILLGNLLLAEHVHGADRLYGIVVIVVVFSVLVQGGLVPAVATRLGVPMRTVPPEPWSLGVRLRDEPDGVHRLTVDAGSVLVGRALRDLDELPKEAWVSFVVRAGRLVRVDGDTAFEAGDEALVLAEADTGSSLRALFGPAAAGSG